ncbi:MAG: hypothetical protein CML68_19435 [Rhodobacteraceae bacterium]|nr:hypothetical protein [Paracoccaceae bacterium]
MAVQIPFDNSYARLPEGFFSHQAPTPVSAPDLIAFNAPLAALLGIKTESPEELARVFSGNHLPEGAEPLAQLYSGHQFGQYNPQLGDGRAVLLGETIGTDGVRRDIQLKGAGPTPYSRNGDGRAGLGPVLREYIVSEAMHSLGIPTTRALAVVSTGDPVYRDRVLPGAVLTRVASSHLRVGTFQVFAARGEIEKLRQLTDFAIARHYPDADGPMGLLTHVCQAQAKLVAQWMAVGFIHGVMNTDNCAISGETIDYGPCAFMDTYHPQTVYSSIDQFGRYAYAQQPEIVVWNMAQLATALIQQLDDKEAAVRDATAIVHAMPDLVRDHWLDQFRAKIGLTTRQESDGDLIADFLRLLATDRADFTNAFRGLADGSARDWLLDRDAFDAWDTRWKARLASESAPEETMLAANPAFIPRNHQVEKVIASALEADFAPFERLNRVLSCPFDDQPEASDLAAPPTEDQVVRATFCGT